jgi:hypothetical protein
MSPDNMPFYELKKINSLVSYKGGDLPVSFHRRGRRRKEDAEVMPVIHEAALPHLFCALCLSALSAVKKNRRIPQRPASPFSVAPLLNDQCPVPNDQ